LTWGTLNGAKALGFSDQLGSLEKEKTPGINLITPSTPDGLEPLTQVKKIC